MLTLDSSSHINSSPECIFIGKWLLNNCCFKKTVCSFLTYITTYFASNFIDHMTFPAHNSWTFTSQNMPPTAGSAQGIHFLYDIGKQTEMSLQVRLKWMRNYPLTDESLMPQITHTSRNTWWQVKSRFTVLKPISLAAGWASSKVSLKHKFNETIFHDLLRHLLLFLKCKCNILYDKINGLM